MNPAPRETRPPAPAVRPPATQPAGIPPEIIERLLRAAATQPATTQPTTTRPGVGSYSGPTELSPNARLEVVGDKIVVSGTQSDLALIETLIEAMEQTGPQTEIRLFSLENTQAPSVAQNLQRLWTEMQQGQPQTTENRVSILPDQISNTILVAGTQANIEKIGGLIAEIEKAPGPIGKRKEWTPIELKHMRASEAADVVRQTLEKLQKQSGASGPSPIDVQVDTRHNSLLIIAPQKDIEQVHKLISIIDQPVTEAFGGAAKLAVFPLVKSDAEKLAKTLEDMIKVDPGQKEAAKEQIRRLQLLQMKPGTTQPAEELASLDLEKPIKIIADKGMNAVIIGTIEANIKPMGEIVRLLDTVPTSEEMVVRIFPLKNADAQNMLEVLQGIFKQGKDLPAVPGGESIKRVPPGPAGAAMAYNVNIASDPRTNMLVVAGRLEQVALAQKLVDEMDIQGIGVSFPVHVVQVQHADPDRLATIVTDLNKQRMETLKNRGVKSTEMEKVFIVADPRTDSLIVSAKEENYKEVQELITKLDLAPANYLGDIHILAVKNLTAADLGKNIEQLWERRISMKGEKGKSVTDKPVIVTDTRSNALVIASNKEDYIAIEALVKQLEDQPLAPSSEIHIQVLKHNDAGKLGPQLQDLFKQRAQMRILKGQEEQPSDRIAIVADAMTNTLMIASGRENYDEIVRLLSQLDVPLDVAGAVRLFPLQHADATRAAKLIDDLITKGIVRGAAGAGTVPEAQKKVSIVTDARSNTLIVSATPENFAIVETLLKQIDTGEQPSIITPESRIFQIKYADAVKVADMLTKLFEGIKKALPQVEQDQMNMTFIPEDRSNVVIVTGSRYGVKRTEELLEKIDRQPGTPSGEPKVYQLKFATANKLSEMLTDLFEKKRPTGEKGNRTPIYIVADEGSNSLIITAPIEEHSIVNGLLQMLDRPSTLAQQMEIIPLQKAKAEDLSDTLTKLLEKQKGAATKGVAFSIAPEPRTNALVVFAGPDMMNNIRIITEKLDSTQPVIELGMRVITLKQAKAEDLAKRLQEFLKGASAGGSKSGSKESSSIINFRSFDEATQKEVLRKLVQQDITITPDARTNSLMVLAPAESADMLENLVRTLDAVKPITAEIQMYLLRNADAEETRKLLEELFQAGNKSGTGKDATERRLVIAGPEGGGLAASSSGGGTTGSYDLAFSVDKRTNTVIAAGSAEYLEIVAQVVDRLDSLDIQDRVQRIVKLRNGVAEEIAKTMEAYFKAEQSAVETKGAEESVIKKLERQVTVQADKSSNTVLLSYNRRMESQVVEMINKLDQQPPQVMIQVLLAEVTLSDSLELGMEFALQDLEFTENATVGPNNTIEGGRHFDLVGGTDVGAAGTGSGFSFTITGEDFSFLYHALQGESRIDVLSRPSIMVADNEKANITVGTRVPVVQNVTVSTGGIVVPSVTYEKVGILLDVEPHINPDGYVNLSVKPTISDLGTSTVSVGSGINLPTFLERSAETVVTVRDGETIVIGGLIRSSDTSSETKVPVAGDVPLLGNLFRATTRKKEKTELLIVLTPKVIHSEDEAHEVSVKSRDQSGLLEKIRLSPLMEKLQVKPGEEGLSSEEGVPTTQPIGPEKPAQYGPPLNVYGPETNAIQDSDDVEVAGLLQPIGDKNGMVRRGQ